MTPTQTETLRNLPDRYTTDEERAAIAAALAMAEEQKLRPLTTPPEGGQMVLILYRDSTWDVGYHVRSESLWYSNHDFKLMTEQLLGWRPLPAAAKEGA